MTRRAALRVAALAAAGAAAAPALARGEDADPGVLYALIRREQAAAFAYRALEAGGAGEPARRFAEHEHEHARALATELEGFALPGPRAPRAAADLDRAAARVAAARGAPAAAALRAAIALEEDLISTYLGSLPRLAVPNVISTAATVLGSHAQHLALLRRRAGADPLAATPA
jgi:hypothetical protein